MIWNSLTFLPRPRRRNMVKENIERDGQLTPLLPLPHSHLLVLPTNSSLFAAGRPFDIESQYCAVLHSVGNKMMFPNYRSAVLFDPRCRKL